MLAAACAPREVRAIAPADQSRCRMPKLHARYEPNSVSTIPRSTAAPGNRLQNQSLPIDMAPKEAVMD